MLNRFIRENIRSMFLAITSKTFACKHWTLLKSYHHIRKVRATHIMLRRRKIIMAFSQCTDLHATTIRCKRCMPLQKNSQSSLFK